MDDGERRRVFETLLDGAFADVLGFSKSDWTDIEAIAGDMKASNLFKGDAVKCLIGAFCLWFEQTGYLEDDRQPDAGHH